ncbi:hypothetical protein ABK040_015184 [Willaertia magna]
MKNSTLPITEEEFELEENSSIKTPPNSSARLYNNTSSTVITTNNSVDTPIKTSSPSSIRLFGSPNRISPFVSPIKPYSPRNNNNNVEISNENCEDENIEKNEEIITNSTFNENQIKNNDLNKIFHKKQEENLTEVNKTNGSVVNLNFSELVIENNNETSLTNSNNTNLNSSNNNNTTINSSIFNPKQFSIKGFHKIVGMAGKLEEYINQASLNIPTHGNLKKIVTDSFEDNQSHIPTYDWIVNSHLNNINNENKEEDRITEQMNGKFKQIFLLQFFMMKDIENKFCKFLYGKNATRLKYSNILLSFIWFIVLIYQDFISLDLILQKITFDKIVNQPKFIAAIITRFSSFAIALIFLLLFFIPKLNILMKEILWFFSSLLISICVFIRDCYYFTNVNTSFPLVLIFQLVGIIMYYYYEYCLRIKFKSAYRLALMKRLVVEEESTLISIKKNIVPEDYVAQLELYDGINPYISDRYSGTCLYCEVVNFDKFVSKGNPMDVFRAINQLIFQFDTLIEELKLTKVRSEEHCYCVVSLNKDQRNSLIDINILHCAIGVMTCLYNYNSENRLKMNMKLGLADGDIYLTLLGHHLSTSLCAYGGAVQLAKILSSASLPGCVHTTSAFYQQFSEQFVFTDKDAMYVKYFGKIKTYLLVCRKGEIPINSNENTSQIQYLKKEKSIEDSISSYYDPESAVETFGINTTKETNYHIPQKEITKPQNIRFFKLHFKEWSMEKEFLKYSYFTHNLNTLLGICFLFLFSLLILLYGMVLPSTAYLNPTMLITYILMAIYFIFITLCLIPKVRQNIYFGIFTCIFNSLLFIALLLAVLFSSTTSNSSDTLVGELFHLTVLSSIIQIHSFFYLPLLIYKIPLSIFIILISIISYVILYNIFMIPYIRMFEFLTLHLPFIILTFLTLGIHSFFEEKSTRENYLLESQIKKKKKQLEDTEILQARFALSFIPFPKLFQLQTMIKPVEHSETKENMMIQKHMVDFDRYAIVGVITIEGFEDIDKGTIIAITMMHNIFLSIEEYLLQNEPLHIHKVKSCDGTFTFCCGFFEKEFDESMYLKSVEFSYHVIQKVNAILDNYQERYPNVLKNCLKGTRIGLASGNVHGAIFGKIFQNYELFGSALRLAYKASESCRPNGIQIGGKELIVKLKEKSDTDCGIVLEKRESKPVGLGTTFFVVVVDEEKLRFSIDPASCVSETDLSTTIRVRRSNPSTPIKNTKHPTNQQQDISSTNFPLEQKDEGENNLSPFDSLASPTNNNTQQQKSSPNLNVEEMNQHAVKYRQLISNASANNIK